MRPPGTVVGTVVPLEASWLPLGLLLGPLGELLRPVRALSLSLSLGVLCGIWLIFRSVRDLFGSHLGASWGLLDALFWANYYWAIITHFKGVWGVFKGPSR